MGGSGATRDAILLLADKIRESQHFSLPVNGTLLDDNWRGLWGERLKLPYPSITIEFATEGKERLLLFAAQGPDHPQHGEGITLWPLRYSKQEQEWQPSKTVYLLPTDWESIESEALRAAHMFAYPVPGIAKEVAEEDSQEIEAHGSIEITTFLGFCEAITCSNVSTERIQAEDCRLNRKRVQAGKLPLYETHILTVEVPRLSTRSREKMGGTHASPRQHLRRGHIRRLTPERKIWVNSCVVGQCGFIDKKYSVRTTL